MYLYTSKKGERLQQKWSLHTAPPLGIHLCMVLNEPLNQVPPPENGKLDLAITLLTLYILNLKEYISRLGISLSCERTVLACMQWK